MKNLTSFCVSLGLLAACQSGASSSDADNAAPSVSAVPSAAISPFAAQSKTELTTIASHPIAPFTQAQDGTLEAAGLTHQAMVANGAIRMTPVTWTGIATMQGAPITLQTSSIDRGGFFFDPTTASPILTNGNVSIDRSGATEIISNRADGVEQSWKFASAPSSEGDLTVRVAASGYAQVSENESGVHLLTPDQLGIRYSTAIWKDSAGGEWPLSTHWDGKEIVITVPASVLDASLFPAVLDPTIGTEARVDVATTGYTGDQASQLAVAYNGTSYLAVWSDQRSGPAANIYGTLVSSSGAVQNARGIAINAVAGVTKTQPAVAFVNNKFVVVWNNNSDILAATVSSTGGSIGQLGNVAATSATETAPKIAGHTTSALAVWQSGTNIVGSLFNGASFGAPFNIAATSTSQTTPTVAADSNGNYLVSWVLGTTNQDIQGQIVTSAGALNGGAITIAAGAGAQLLPASTYDGTDYVVTFTNGADNNIYGTRVTTEGAVLDTHLESMVAFGGKALSAVHSIKDQSTIACDSASCLVTWSDRRNVATTGFDLYGQRFDFTLTAAGSEIPMNNVVRNQQFPASAGASSGTGFFAAWEDQRTGGASIAVGTRITSAGAVSDNTGIILNTSTSSERAVAYSRGATAGQLAVWADSREIGTDIESVRYNTSGLLLDSTAVSISNATADQETPSVSFDGTEHVVVWTDYRNPTADIYGARYKPNGSLLDATGIAITTAADIQAAPDVASTPTGTSLVVWADRRNSGTTGFDIYGAIVNSSGAVVVADIVISNAPNDQNRPAVVYDATDNVFVVVWGDQRTSANTDIYGARISTAGTVLDTSGVLISAAANLQELPDIAISGSTMLAVWEDRRADANGDIYGSRLTAAGSLTVVDPSGIAIATTSANHTPTTVGIAGGQFIVAWTDGRNSATTGTDIYGNSVLASSGALGGEFVVSNSADAESQPRFQNDPNDDSNQANLVFDDFRTDLGILRVYRILITSPGANGQTCTTTTGCASGFCVDGYCCDSACGGTQNSLPTDCQACSIAHGAAANGTCGVTNTQTLCRGYSDGDSFCDLRDYCDGISTACPADLGHNGGVVCTGTCGSGHCPVAGAGGAPHVCTCP